MLSQQNSVDNLKSFSLAGTEQEIKFITTVLDLPPQAAILDLYCGYGRHAIELAKRGYNVIGMDATQAFLDMASQKAREENVNIVFRQCDMRELDYTRKFHAVINMFAAFGYFSDKENQMVLQRIANSLKDEGLFLIDLLNRDWMVRNNLNRYWREPNGDCVLSYKVELVDGIATMKRQLINQITGAKTQYEFTLRAYSLTEMASILQQSGFQIQTTYGGFDKREYGPDTPRMIIVAKRQ
ncbi:MAG: class I SAM-dependent methyltransferase [Veillonellales bacterium]